MKRSEVLDEIWELILDEECDTQNWRTKLSNRILTKLEELGMHPTEEDPILLKRHVIFWDKE